MFRNFISFCLFLSIFQLCSLSFAETVVPSEEADKLYTTASQLEESGKFDEAKSLYGQVTRQFAGSQYSSRAQIDIDKVSIVALIESGKFSQAQANLDKFATSYNSHTYFPPALYRIAERYEEARQLDKAKAIYQQIQQQYPNDQYGDRSKVDAPKTAIVSLIESGKDTQAQTALDKFESDFADNAYLPTALYRVAERFEEAGWSDNAKAIYAKIAQQYQSDPYAQRAKIDVIKTAVICAIESGNDSQAQTNFDKLGTDFKSDTYLPAALYRIAERYEEWRKFDKAKAVYVQIAQQYPNSQFAVRSQIDVLKIDAICLVDSDKDAEIQTIIGKLKNDFKGEGYLPAALYRIAERYEDAKKYDAAKGIYGQVAQEFDSSLFAGRAKLNIAKIDIIVSVVPGSEAAVQSAVDKLAAAYDSASYPMISNAVYLIAEKCYAEAAKSEVDQTAGDKLVVLSAALLDKYVLGKIYGRDNQASAYYQSGLNYDRLSNYAKAAQAFKDAYRSNPRHIYADYCIFASGRCYENLLANKSIPEAEAKPAIKAQYEKLLKNYPKSSYAAHASDWLQDNQ